MTERYQIINAIAAVPLVAVCIAMLNGNYHPVAVGLLSLPLLIPVWVFGRKLTGRPVVRPRSQQSGRLWRLVMTERYQIINAIAAVPLVAVCIAMLNGNYHPVAVGLLSLPLLIPVWVFGRKLTGRPVVRPRSQQSGRLDC